MSINEFFGRKEKRMREKKKAIKIEVAKIFSICCFCLGTILILAGFSKTSYFVYIVKEKLGITEVKGVDENATQGGLFKDDTLISVAETSNGEIIDNNSLVKISKCHQSINESRCFKMIKQVENIVPNSIIETIEQFGFDIVLTGKDLRAMIIEETGWDAGWDYDGVTFPGYAGYTRIWSSSTGGVRVLVHEIGHAYDFACEDLSLTEEFKAIYHEESRKLFPLGGLYSSTEREYFAESFNYYLQNRWLLKLLAPQTFNYFESILKD